jgi:myo-inositol-1(or 4)-monophosphatase
VNDVPDHLSVLQDRLSTDIPLIIRNAMTASKPDIFTKSSDIPGDVVTDTDRFIQGMLREYLSDILPNSDFLGEEDFEDATSLAHKQFWIVDPLDGTLNYASQLPFYGASIALMQMGVPVLGFVYDYSSHTVFTAASGDGAKINGQLFSWNSELAARSPVGISSGYLARLLDLSKSGQHNEERGLLGHRFRIFGCQAVQLCWAAQGRLKVNINLESKLWDDVAGALICKEAGAGYETLYEPNMFPLRKISKALQGESIFSVSGTPDLVSSFKSKIILGSAHT